MSGVSEENALNCRLALLEPLVDAVVEHARLYNPTADETIAIQKHRVVRDA